jgi:DNA end-binding protein Ku
MAEEASKTIEITEFVPLAKVDPIYFEGAYYLGPDKGGEKAYRLLSEAMRQTGRCALAKWAARGKQYLTLMRPIDNGIIMQVLHYADEVRPFSEIPVGDAVVKEPELKLAVQLIEQIATDEFKPESYVDDVRTRYHEAIQRKVEGQEVTAAATPEAPKGQIIDLMEALKASLAAKGPRAVPAAGSAPAPAAKPAKRAAAAVRTTEARTLRAPKAAAGGKRR